MRMPRILLSENTKILIPIATLIIIIGFAIGTTYSFTVLKEQLQAKDNAIEQRISVVERHDLNQDIKIEKLESATVDINVSVKAIETDVKWLRAYMEDRWYYKQTKDWEKK